VGSELDLGRVNVALSTPRALATCYYVGDAKQLHEQNNWAGTTTPRLPAARRRRSSSAAKAATWLKAICERTHRHSPGLHGRWPRLRAIASVSCWTGAWPQVCSAPRSRRGARPWDGSTRAEHEVVLDIRAPGACHPRSRRQDRLSPNPLGARRNELDARVVQDPHQWPEVICRTQQDHLAEGPRVLASMKNTSKIFWPRTCR